MDAGEEKPLRATSAGVCSARNSSRLHQEIGIVDQHSDRPPVFDLEPDAHGARAGRAELVVSEIGQPAARLIAATDEQGSASLVNLEPVVRARAECVGSHVGLAFGLAQWLRRRPSTRITQ